MRKKRYIVVVAVTATTHLAYLAYLPSGGFLAMRWPRSLWLHVATVVWGTGVVGCGWPCPLTSLESWARARAGMAPLPETGFTDRYLAGLLYPADATRAAQAMAFTVAGASWALLAARRRAVSAAR